MAVLKLYGHWRTNVIFLSPKITLVRLYDERHHAELRHARRVLTFRRRTVYRLEAGGTVTTQDETLALARALRDRRDD